MQRSLVPVDLMPARHPLDNAQDVVTEIMLLAMLYNHLVGQDQAPELAAELDPEELNNLGLLVDVRGRIHVIPTTVKAVSNRNKITFQRMINSLWKTIETTVLEFHHDAI